MTLPAGRPEATIDLHARLAIVGDLDESPLMPGSWFITHGIGKPAEGTFTEVAFTHDALRDADGVEHPEHVLDAVVRLVAGQLYGTAWAFHYRPDQYADSIERWSMRRRERVLVTSVEVYE